MQLRAAREKSGMTQAQVAILVGVSGTHYQNIEYDKSEPGVRIANRIAKVVNSTAVDLWGYGAATPTTEKEPDGNPT